MFSSCSDLLPSRSLQDLKYVLTEGKIDDIDFFLDSNFLCLTASCAAMNTRAVQSKTAASMAFSFGHARLLRHRNVGESSSRAQRRSMSGFVTVKASIASLYQVGRLHRQTEKEKSTDTMKEKEECQQKGRYGAGSIEGA